MPASRESAVRDELEAWLVYKLEHGGLIGLPLYRTAGDVIGRRPESYARELLEALRGEGASPIDPKAWLASAAAFRRWADSHRRRVAWTRRSHINLDEPGFDSIHRRDEIHRYLEAIAHPDPNAPGFVVPPPLSWNERKERRKAALAERGITRAWNAYRPVALALLVVLTALLLVFGRAALELDAVGGPPGRRAAIRALMAAVLFALVTAAPALITLFFRGWWIKPSRKRNPLSDPWLDPGPSELRPKGSPR